MNRARTIITIILMLAPLIAITFVPKKAKIIIWGIYVMFWVLVGLFKANKLENEEA